MGARRPDEPVAAWIQRAHGGRQRSGLLGLPRAHDLADPIGRPLNAFEHTRDQLRELVVDLARLLAPDLPETSF
jgi:hypothetical protein